MYFTLLPFCIQGKQGGVPLFSSKYNLASSNLRKVSVFFAYKTILTNFPQGHISDSLYTSTMLGTSPNKFKRKFSDMADISYIIFFKNKFRLIFFLHIITKCERLWHRWHCFQEYQMGIICSLNKSYYSGGKVFQLLHTFDIFILIFII